MYDSNLIVISRKIHATPQKDIVTAGNLGISQSPTHGRVKCNIDASFFDQFNRKGIYICIRDEDDIFELAKTIYPYFSDVFGSNGGSFGSILCYGMVN